MYYMTFLNNLQPHFFAFLYIFYRILLYNLALLKTTKLTIPKLKHNVHLLLVIIIGFIPHVTAILIFLLSNVVIHRTVCGAPHYLNSPNIIRAQHPPHPRMQSCVERLVAVLLT